MDKVLFHFGFFPIKKIINYYCYTWSYKGLSCDTAICKYRDYYNM
jgi:hypothetical protein